MKNSNICLQCTNYADVLLRVVVGLIFVIAGFGKLFGGMERFTGMLGGIGIPAPGFFAFLVGTIELVGGIMLILGLWTSIPAALLSFIMLVAIVTVHNGDGTGFAKLWSDARYPLLLMVATLRYVGTSGYMSLLSCMKKK